MAMKKGSGGADELRKACDNLSPIKTGRLLSRAASTFPQNISSTQQSLFIKIENLTFALLKIYIIIGINYKKRPCDREHLGENVQKP